MQIGSPPKPWVSYRSSAALASSLYSTLAAPYIAVAIFSIFS